MGLPWDGVTGATARRGPCLQVMAYASPPVEVTEYAINLLLDAYLRSVRSDKLHREVTRLLATGSGWPASPTSSIG